MTSGPVVGIVSAGAMGSALGARLRENGARVLVSLEGRSPRTARFAADAGLEDAGSLASLVASSAVVLSVVPPEAAVDVASAIADAGGGASAIVADLNAVSPSTAREIASLLGDAGIEAVDGAISGPPPSSPGTTRIYLSGTRADDVASLPFDGVDRVVVGDDVGLASAVKMCTASVYKGRVALLAQALRTAHVYGVVEHVLADLSETGLTDGEQAGAALARASAKAWRYVAEMGEIAVTQSSAGLTPDLFRALASVYAELADHAVGQAPEDVEANVELMSVLARLSRSG